MTNKICEGEDGCKWIISRAAEDQQSESYIVTYICSRIGCDETYIDTVEFQNI